MFALRLAVLFGLLTLPTQAAEMAERAAFKDWSVTCSKFNSCAATTSVDHDISDSFLPDIRLSVARDPYETFWEVSFEIFTEQPAKDTVISLTVDDAKFQFQQPDQIAAFDRLNHYFLQGDKAQKTLDSMVLGHTLNLSFNDVDGETRRANLSLAGLAAAMLWIDEQQTRVGSERVAGQPPNDRTKVTTRLPAPISETLQAQHEAGDICDHTEDMINNTSYSFRITATQTLHLLPCWSGAYNFGYHAYIESPDSVLPVYLAEYAQDRGWSGTADLVNPWYDENTGVLSTFYKGRGIADCGTSGLWMWHKWGFRMLEFAAKDNCDGLGNPGEFPVVFRAPDYTPPPEPSF